jgi:hypothetical protein
MPASATAATTGSGSSSGISANTIIAPPPPFAHAADASRRTAAGVSVRPSSESIVAQR